MKSCAIPAELSRFPQIFVTTSNLNRENITIGEKHLMKPHESPPPPRRIKKSIRGDSDDSWPVWNRGIKEGRENLNTRADDGPKVNADLEAL